VTAIRLLSPEGALIEDDANQPWLDVIRALPEEQLQDFHRMMVTTRRFDVEAGNLQRQGQLALWIPSVGQEAAQVGSGYAARPQDAIFPSYREHAVARIRGVDLMRVIELLRGLDHGGWDPTEHGNFRLYTLVLASQTLHATGYAMGIALDGGSGTGDPEHDEAVMVYFGDGASSEGDANEALVFAASYQTPEVFFLQNNHYAISVPVSRQSRTPLVHRGEGFGIPSWQIDGNDVLAAYAVTRTALDGARAGGGPRFIEALTYRLGAHTTSDEPSKYRSEDEVAHWRALDPVHRYEAYLRSLGASESFFAEVLAEAEDLAADARRRTLALPTAPLTKIFDHVYTDPHPVVEAEREWMLQYEAAMNGGAA